MSDVTVTNVPEKKRWEAHVDGALAGFAEYRDRADDSGAVTERVFFHTEVDDAFEGQGVASQLVRFALDDAIERGFRIVPVCPYVKAWLERHDDYAQHAVAVRPRHLEAVQARQRRSS